MTATATYDDIYAGQITVRLVPMTSDKARFWWKGADGTVFGGQARAMSASRCISYAKQHRRFSSIKAD